MEVPQVREQTPKQELIARLASLPRRDFIRDVATLAESQHENGEPVPLEVMKLAIARASGSFMGDDDTDLPPSPPEDLFEEMDPTVLKRGENSFFPDGIVDASDMGSGNDGILVLVTGLLEKVAPKDQAELMARACQAAYFHEDLDSNEWSNLLVDMCKKFKGNSDVSKAIFEYISANGEDFLRTHHDAIIYYESSIEALIQTLSKPSNIDTCLYDLAQFPPDQYKDVLGMLVNTVSFSVVINSIRAQVDEAHIKPAERANLERLGKHMLGIPADDDRPFHTSLNSVYRVLDFANYKPNLEKNAIERDMWSDIIGTDEAAKTKVIIDLGCGTGRMSNALAEAGYKNVIGMDTSLENLDKARKSNTSGEEVHYVASSMMEIAAKPESIDEMICGGRTLPHAENYDKFERVFRQANIVLKEGGHFLFDLPNVEKGNYAKNRALYMNLMEKMGMPTTRTDGSGRDMPNSYVLVDSADGKNLYNRYCPSEQIVRDICFQNGFELEIIKREPLTAGSEDENVYFKATKVKTIPHAPHLSWQGQTQPSYWQQSADD